MLVYVTGAEPSFTDLLWFWNARAMRPGEEGVDLLLGVEHVLPNADVLKELVHRTARGTPSLSLVSMSVPADELRGLLSVIGIPEHEGTKWTEQRFGKAPVEPTAVVNGDPRGGWFGEREVGAVTDVTTALYRPGTTVAFESPLPVAPRFVGQRTDLRLRSQLFDVPRRPAVAPLFHQNANWVGGALRLRSALLPRYELNLRLPGPDQILDAAVALPYRASDKARQLRAVLAREGGSLDLYRDPVVLSVIEALSPIDSRDLKRSLAQLGKLDEPDRELILAAVASVKEPDLRALDEVRTLLKPPAPTGVTAKRVAEALGELVDRAHVHRGLRADCTLCDTRELRQLTEAAAAPTCRACRAPAAYAAGARGEPAMYYRLSPVMRLISANGGLPVLAAAAVLQAEGVHLLAGAEATSDGEDFEVDLLGWGRTKVLAGEVKRRAARLADVENDVRNSARFGADVHIAAALGIIDDDLRAQLSTACAAEGLELRVLDASQLLV
ncbi:hypothetical protein [Geodermatophilus poikilotrophus]|uniref:Uncharacterized protein n=1 Tax=Geodermatophilus poikilotrophus TaxID=1333667 RepID=A0A1H9YDY2_9ACTN|nr:hypothetical protein [Geodermatophilus poikilotrophus]SES67095.1 hypothetical protein SAMN04488546_0049 [Geodermatophilus poikilotrophus]